MFGPESSGKTTLAMHAIAEIQRQGGTAALIDAEHAFDPVYSGVSRRTLGATGRGGCHARRHYDGTENSRSEALSGSHVR